jgi:hypothetical protein
LVIGAGNPTQLAPILKTVCSEQQRKVQMPQAVTWLGQDLFTYLWITMSDAIKGEKNGKRPNSRLL